MRVGPKGQVVIPQAVRRELGIGPGDEVLVEEYEGGALVRKVGSSVDLLGLLADGPGSVGMADFEEARRRERDREGELTDGPSAGAEGS